MLMEIKCYESILELEEESQSSDSFVYEFM